MIIWTRNYRPFIMGGDCNVPMSTSIPTEQMTGPFEEGGYELYTVTSPLDGDRYIVEGRTGGIVGSSLEEVCADIKAANPEFMSAQITWALQELGRAELVDADEF